MLACLILRKRIQLAISLNKAAITMLIMTIIIIIIYKTTLTTARNTTCRAIIGPIGIGDMIYFVLQVI